MSKHRGCSCVPLDDPPVALQADERKRFYRCGDHLLSLAIDDELIDPETKAKLDHRFVPSLSFRPLGHRRKVGD